MLNNKFTYIYIITCISMLFILLLAKYYVILCAIPGILFLLIKRFIKVKSNTIILLFSFAICFIGLLIGRKIGGSLDVINTLTLKHNDFVSFSLSLDKIGSLMDSSMLKPTIGDFLKHVPDALYKSLFKPFPWDMHNIMSVLPAIENIILILLIVLAFFNQSKYCSSKELLIFSFSFVLCLNILNGLIVPVFGALVRYKVPALPFLFASLICLIDFEQIKKLFHFSKK